MSWGLNVNLNVYNQTLNLISKHSRYPGIYPNVMAEMLSLLKKRESKKIDVSKELSSIEKEFNDKLEKVNAKLSALEESVEKSSQKLLQMICGSVTTMKTQGYLLSADGASLAASKTAFSLSCSTTVSLYFRILRLLFIRLNTFIETFPMKLIRISK